MLPDRQQIVTGRNVGGLISLKTGFGLGIEHHIKWPIDDDFLRVGKQAVTCATEGCGVSANPGGGTQGIGLQSYGCGPDELNQ